MAMLSIHAGYDISYLTDAVGKGGADYYLSAAGQHGEPPGFWMGKGAQALGLSGEVDPKVMRALYHHDTGPDGSPLDTPGGRRTYERQRETIDDQIEATVAAKVAELGAFPTEREIREIRLMARAGQRNAVPFFDHTLSLEKSVSVTHASYLAAARQAREDGELAEAQRCEAKAEAIAEALREGARMVVRLAEQRAAYIRTGHHGGGQGQWRDAAGLTAAGFLQHTSRDGDPQLHCHIAILNRAQRADGEDKCWRTLDSRSLHRERLAIAAYAGLVVEQKLQQAGFALVKREDGNGAEIGGVTPVTMAAFSSRRTAITPAIQRLADEYTATHGHAPSRRALWSLRQWATLETRKSKQEVQRSAAGDLAAWTEQSRAAEVQILADVQQAVAAFAGERGEPPELDSEGRHLAIRIAVAEVQRQNATWTAAQLAWELRRSLHVLAPQADPEAVLSSLLAEALAGQVPGADIVPLAPAPDPTDVSILGVRESDGVSVYRPPGEGRYATAGQLDTEEYLLSSARKRVRQAVTDDEAELAVASAALNDGQRAVVKGLLTTRTATTVLVGPAGTGKTHVVAKFAYAWTAHTGRRVVGLTTATNAARVLAHEGLAETYNIAQFLGKLPDTAETRGNIPVYRDDVLVVDEASQVSSADLAAIQVVASQAGARLILTGDTAQLSSVEAGGIMRLIARDQGHWQLQEVRRFAEPWEAKASLRLRGGDVKVWDAYKTHGRIRSGPKDQAEAEAVRMWITDYLRGKQTLLLAGTNAEAADLARQARQRLIDYTVLAGAAEITLSDGNDAGTGDLVRARLNVKIDAAGLLCPRRLHPDTRWHACLVPAFDAGVTRGLGQVPAPKPLTPAWTDQDSITLPLYFHWSFGTGPDGDFESLARRLHPFVIESEDGMPTVGTVKMHIGAAGGPVRLPEGHPGHIVQMDGALRAVQQADRKLSEIPADLRSPLGQFLDEIADPSGSGPEDGAVGPPLYGSWPANKFAVAGTNRGWFAELNLDPRARVAAGLGAEVVRKEQEDLMTACWEQVGAVLKANSLLSRSRLSIEASTRFHARTLALLSPERLLAYAGPLTDRTPFEAGTVRAAVGPTSLPDAVIDPATRRLTAPTGRFVRKAAGRSGLDAHAIGRRFVATLAAGTTAADPTTFVPAGIAPPAGRDPVTVPGGLVDLSPIGLAVTRPAAEAVALTQGIAAVRSQPVPPAGQRLALRADLRTTGLLTTRQVGALQRFTAAGPDGDRLRTDGISELLAAATEQPGSTGFLVGRETAGGGLRIGAVDVTSRGAIVLRTAATEPNEVLGRIEGRVSDPRTVVSGLPVGTLRPGGQPVVVRPGPVEGAPVVEPARPGPAGGILTGPTVTIPPLVRDAAVLTRFEAAVSQLEEISIVGDARPAAEVVAFPMIQAANALKQRCSPANAHVARVGTMLHFGGEPLSQIVAGARIDGLAVSPLADRIMAYPELPDPAYRMLARYDRDRLLPGVDSIPPDSITLLETNPRFLAAFLAGLNHELNRELLWRRYPADQKGTPVRHFWDRAGGAADIPAMHTWRPLTALLADEAGGESNLVLLLRGELLRRYPNTVVLAIAASGPDTPGMRDGDVKHPIFSGYLDPDITFFGFDLIDDDLTRGNGWFFALQEQVTEPRFALDETIDPHRTGRPATWRAVAWPDTPVAAGMTFTVNNLRAVATANSLTPPPTNGANIAEALFQNPVQVLVHARHLVATGQA